MHDNEKLIRNFYAAFAQRDAASMARCYDAGIFFSDPVFPALRGREAGAMWAMLCKQAGPELTITLLEASGDDSGGRATWRATYNFSKTGRPVENNIEAIFAIREGKIIRHIDRFNFWRWSSQALGPVGSLLGWFAPLKAKVRKEAARSLEKFMAASQV